VSFLNDIKNQPQQTREIMFGLSVFITILLVGMIWFHSFQRNLYVLMNPEDGLEKAFAVESLPAPSLFGFIWQSVGEVKGLVSGLFTNDQRPTTNDQRQEKTEVESGKVYILPLPEYK